MTNDHEALYRKLARHLDDLPGGFPATESGVELRILKRLFEPEEAALALHLTLIPEPVRVIARRAGLNQEEAAQRLETMARRGLLFSIELPGRPALYVAMHFVVGIWEYHVNDLDPELIRDFRQYLPELFQPQVWQKAPQLRPIPVRRSVDAGAAVLPHESAEELVRQQRRILVAPCICRREHRLTGHVCDRPEETCLVFGGAAYFYQRNGLGRTIDLAECLDILQMADETGLVLQPSNSKKIMNLCCCCGDCCQVLTRLKSHPQPASLVHNAFRVVVEPDECQGCGLCVQRCQMEALSLQDDQVALQADRCIGCGLCVSTCPSGSLRLERVPEEEQPRVPDNITETYMQMRRARGKMGPASMAWMGLKSKMDRLLARS